jgi:hypothetical protein
MAHSTDDILQDRSGRGYKNVKDSRKLGNIYPMELSILYTIGSLGKRNSNKDGVTKDLYRMVSKEVLRMSYNLIQSKPENIFPGTTRKTLAKIYKITVPS